MRKLSVLLLLLIAVSLTFGAVLYAQTWHTTNSATVGWDAVTSDAGDISYRLYLANAVTDPQHTNPATLTPDTTELTYVITLGVQGRYYVGVQTVLTVGADEILSEVNWSDNPVGNINDEAWGIQYFEIAAPGGFGPQ